MPRAAFLLDRVMGSVGLSGRAFIPLLSSFACAIPGIMATRTIQNPRDRLATIMIAPLMTCSARLPVYALIIGAFIPERTVWGGLELQGLVLFALYIAGVASAMGVAFVLKRSGSGNKFQSLMLELPAYHWPNLRNLLIGLWQRVEIFMSRVGTIILALMVILWALSSFPGPPAGATGPAIQYSIAGHLGAWLAVIFKPIGFNWQISIALVPGIGGARSRRGRARYRVRAVGHGFGHERRVDPLDHPVVESAHRIVTAGLVCVRAAMPVDVGNRQTRNQFVALSHHHGGLSVWLGLPRFFLDLSYRPGAHDMNPIADDLLVGSLLAASLGYALVRLGPRSVRRKIQAAAAHGLAAAPAFFRLGGVAQRLTAASLQQAKGACGGCDNCETAPPSSSTSQVNAAEVSVPLAKIGRRGER